MNGSRLKSKQYWDAYWKQALKNKICPLQGCSLLGGTCKHLDFHLKYHTDSRKMYPGFYLITDLDSVRDLEVESREELGGDTWKLFKKLRKFALDRDQIAILIRRFVYNMDVRTIADDMGYLSKDTVHRRLTSALSSLKRRGYK